MKNHIHVQIALVGGQPTPVYQGIVHMQPDQVILVCSQETINVADDIRSQLPSYTDDDVMTYVLSDTDLGEMYKIAETIENVLPNDISISLNVTGGMKLWSIIFNQVICQKRKDCHSFFIGQDGTFFDLSNKTSKGKVAFGMDTQFRILGHHLDEYMLYSDYTSADFEVLDQVLKIALSHTKGKYFTNVTAIFLEKYKDTFGNVSLEKDFEVSYSLNKLAWHASSKKFECTLGNLYTVFTSEHVERIVLNTGWFELYVARYIAQIYDSKDIRMNCVFRSMGNIPKNEIDIIVNTGSKLIFVECKTQIFNITDVDKFRSAVRNYGGLGSKPLFVTYYLMKPEGLEKCKEHRISTFFMNNPAYTTEDSKTKSLSEVFKKMNQTWNV